MESGTVSAAELSTGSRTMADLVVLAAEKHRQRTAIKHKVGDRWVDVTYDELADTVKRAALGLIDLGIEPGEKVAILSNTRPEWTYANFGTLGAGAVTVSIYQTNSPQECHYVLHHSESRAVFVEDLEQLEKIRAIRDELPNLEFVIVFEPPEGGADDAIAFSELCERGARLDEARYHERVESVSRDDVCLYIYTSGTTGPPKACILTHGNYRDVTTMTESQGTIAGDELIYLFLPLAHAFALLIQFVSFDLGSAVAYWEKDTQKIVPNLMELHPTYFPSVPRIFEKIYTLATSNAPDREALDRAVRLGLEVRLADARGEEVPSEKRAAFEKADQELFSNVRNLFGGRLKQAVSGAAPIAKEILEFFYACGVPVMEGYGMTETSTVASANTLEDFRFGSVGKPLPGVEAKIADDGELLLRGPNIFKGYFKNEEATRETLEDGWLHTGDLGRIDEDGFIYITGRKKDIIITAGGKNITPANLENSLKQSRWISQAVVLGDRRPYLVALITLDPEEIPAFAQMHGLEPDQVRDSEQMRAEIQKAVDKVNSEVGRVEQIKKFKILPHDLSQETGELTPTMKVKRNVVAEKFAADVEALYAS
ncbi:MAG: long-chain fatty acid--CoA ligase [Thermoleophilaceae bacterium]|nr:long-chain fatty acid--CoA ligase [Thermoleophilaceae bacterium]